MSTRSALPPTRSVTLVPARVNLNAFCRRFPITAPRICRSASIAMPSSTGSTTSVMPLAFASKRGRRRELLDELGHQKSLEILDGLGETDLGERAVDEGAQSREAALQHRAGTPGDADVPGLEHLEREYRRC